VKDVGRELAACELIRTDENPFEPCCKQIQYSSALPYLCSGLGGCGVETSITADRILETSPVVHGAANPPVAFSPSSLPSSETLLLHVSLTAPNHHLHRDFVSGRSGVKRTSELQVATEKKKKEIAQRINETRVKMV